MEKKMRRRIDRGMIKSMDLTDFVPGFVLVPRRFSGFVYIVTTGIVSTRPNTEAAHTEGAGWGEVVQHLDQEAKKLQHYKDHIVIAFNMLKSDTP